MWSRKGKKEVVCGRPVVCGELPLVANTDLKPRSGYQGRLFHGTYQILIYSRAVRETPPRESPLPREPRPVNPNTNTAALRVTVHCRTRGGGGGGG